MSTVWQAHMCVEDKIEALLQQLLKTQKQTEEVINVKLDDMKIDFIGKFDAL